MNCGMECIKYLLFIFNFVCALGGLVIVVFGVIALNSPDIEVIKKANPDNFSFEAAVYFIIAIGAIIFIITFFGCCGAIRESHCMTVTYGVLLLTLLVIQVALASYIFYKLSGEDAKHNIDLAVKKLFNSYFNPSTDDSVKLVINNLQKLGECCGFHNYQDYTSNSENIKGIIPGSCCNKPFSESCSASQVRVPGCQDKLFELFKSSSHTLGIVALCIAGVELIGIIFSFCLANSILNVERRGYKV